MKRAIGKPTKAQQAYHDSACALGCVVCRYRIERKMQPNRMAGHVQIHHRNLGDLHGQKQLGHDSIVAMCSWHHEGDCVGFLSVEQMRETFGPSFKHHARDFREWTADVLPGYPRGTEAWQKWMDEILNLTGDKAA